jgi:hypothetical protein
MGMVVSNQEKALYLNRLASAYGEGDGAIFYKRRRKLRCPHCSTAGFHGREIPHLQAACRPRSSPCEIPTGEEIVIARHTQRLLAK